MRNDPASSFIPGQSRFLLRPDPTPKHRSGKAPLANEDDAPGVDPEKTVLCRQCRQVVTLPSEKRVVSGAHIHTFANPTGILFEIACYRKAEGCGYLGPASAEFTWFPGHVWRIAVCRNCLIHLGWRFGASDGHFFHGLITSRIILPQA
ncbi:conserved hypothetical protein [Desulfosarcina cetonica]|uniref:cereblon family protein n=1 Tax=Desulfosarcina cetonica TaxID=90730 RepID=UPI0006D0B7BC|nr:cereblon family protein [Desulfosarcina cetonica]VTR65079.1 conserved hypothetical protein [Desulfosarcina cetonica]